MLRSMISAATSRNRGKDPRSEMTMPMLMKMFSKELEGSAERMFPGTVSPVGDHDTCDVPSCAKSITRRMPITV